MLPDGIIWLSKMEKKERQGVLLCHPRNSARSWGASHIPSNPGLHQSSMWGQGRELNTKSVPPPAPGPAGDVAAGARLLGKSSASPTVVSEDPEVRGCSLGTTELCPSRVLRSCEVTPAAAAGQEQASTACSRHLPPGKTSVLLMERHTRALEDDLKIILSFPLRVWGSTLFPLSTKSSIFNADSLASPEKAGTWY